MATEVSSLVRVLGGGGGGYKDEQHRTVGNDSHGEKSTALITRDLLGGSSSIESQELDLDLQVPNGWEKRLDLQSGKVYIQRCNTLTQSPISEQKNQGKSTAPKLQDLNFPSTQSNVPLNLFDESNLDLKLVSSALPTSNYQSVCTLDKVKSALERAEKEPIRKRSTFLKSSISATSPSYSSSSSSMREPNHQEEESDQEKMISSPMAAGCPGCLSYVLIMKNNPKCPRCNSIVPIPTMKKPRIDLNISI